MAERLQYGDQIKKKLGKHALHALRMLDTMFESAFPPLKKKEPSGNDISLAKMSFPSSKKDDLLEMTFLRKKCPTSQLLA